MDTGYSLEDLPEEMNDTDEWLERVREIWLVKQKNGTLASINTYFEYFIFYIFSYLYQRKMEINWTKCKYKNLKKQNIQQMYLLIYDNIPMF